jgi:hypothetical protein
MLASACGGPRSCRLPGPMKSRFILPGNPGHHAVQIYAESAALCESVTDFMADGLAAAQPALVIATPLHCDLVIRGLSARRFDVPGALAQGAMLLFDARESLDVTTGSSSGIDAARFREVVGLALERLMQQSGDAVARVYSELSDVLWRAGQIDAALQVEAFWNDLLTEFPFSLLCGCSMTPFFAHPAHEQACAVHTDVYHAQATV